MKLQDITSNNIKSTKLKQMSKKDQQEPSLAPMTARNHEVKVLTYTLPTNFLGETLNVVPETATIVGETIM